MTTQNLSATPAASPATVLAAIKSASRETGSDFDYLLSIAQRESNLDGECCSHVQRSLVIAPKSICSPPADHLQKWPFYAKAALLFLRRDGQIVRR